MTNPTAIDATLHAAMTRRQLLGLVAAASGAMFTPGCASSSVESSEASSGGPNPEPSAVDLPALGSGNAASVFPSSVASGDPTSSGVVLWTQVDPSTIDTKLDLLWQIATDAEFTQPVLAGKISTTDLSAENDFALKLDLDGWLEPNRFYYYRFAHAGTSSRAGRLRTLPLADAEVERLKLLVMCCQDYTLSYFHAFAEMAEREADYLVHLGDFIYESAIVPLRPIALPSGAQYASSRQDLLTIYRTHRSDPNLQAMLEAHTLLATFDDHEFANDLYFDGERPRGPDHPLDADPSAMSGYVRDALDVWFHYLPVRVRYTPQADFPDVMDVERSFRFGRLAELVLDELRMHRSPHPCGEGNYGERQLVLEDSCAARHDAGRTMLGTKQKQWLIDTLTHSQAQWQVLAQPIPFSPIQVAPTPATLYEVDHWDGYTAEREELLHAFNGLRNLIVLAGDMHAFGAATLLDGYPHGPAVGTEFIASCAAATPIASVNPPANAFLQGPTITANNPHFDLWDGTRNGWLEVEFTASACTVVMRAMQAQIPLANPSIELARYTVPSDSAELQREDTLLPL